MKREQHTPKAEAEAEAEGEEYEGILFYEKWLVLIYYTE